MAAPLFYMYMLFSLHDYCMGFKEKVGRVMAAGSYTGYLSVVAASDRSTSIPTLPIRDR